MKKKLLVLVLGMCLLFTACANKKPKEIQQPETKQQDLEEKSEESDNKKNLSENEKQSEELEKEETKDSDKEEEIEEEEGVTLTKIPEVIFTDYSQNIDDKESGVRLLSVTENCPVISISENEAAAEKMNLAFEQKHEANQAYIEEDLEIAKSAYQDLSEEDKKSWTGYGYGSTYKVVYNSTEILSIVEENYEWQGTPHPNTWTSAYCFDVTTGKLLSLADILTNKTKAGKIVEQHILDKITKEPYKDYLLEDYESFVSDILTEEVFYLNEKGLVVICNPYMVTTHAGGIIEIEVPYEELKEVMNKDYIQET
ncbi:MAG: DUF3298 and DUF4163 domain-containing protein [Lachnospiraceae bacterium]